MDANISKEALKLSDIEKLELINILWESLDNPYDIPLTDEQKAELDRRLEAHIKNPENVSSWEDVKKRIQHT